MTSRNIQIRNFKFSFEEIVVGEGFTAGLLHAIGVDPEGTILSTTMQVATAVNPSVDVTPFKMISVVLTIITLVSLFVAYMLGGLLGLLSVLIALVSGLIIIQYQSAGVMLILLAFIVAYFAVMNRDSASNNDY